ncbi:surface carbohydrate biosynthesis protein [Candidatus Pelagibacter sp. HIMB1709]|uniref:surface carbohydrate biosynthesis protein n=1 Tax=Candidatus Pelagibacter sp. HIMB1709 TaxID=3413367 RepID=UPI003F86C2B6
MKKKIIFIIIESVKRELDSKTLLALKALKRNYRVVIGQKAAIRSLLKFTNPGIVILKSFGPRNTKHIDFLKENNFKIVSNDEELILALDFEDKINWRMNNENLNKLDILLCVGEGSDYPIIKKKFNSIIKNVLVCGNIRLELLKKKYEKLLEKDSARIKKKFGDYILLLTAFAKINKIRETHQIDYVFNRIVEANIDPESHHIFLANEQVNMQRDALLQTLKFLDNFEKNFPNKKLVISPHPNEKFDFWKNYIAKRKFRNIVINTDLHSTSYPLINSCEMLISTNSTSLLEAYFLKKKTVNFLGKKTRASEIDLLKRISKVVRSVDELNATIRNFETAENKTHPNEGLIEIKNSSKNFDSFESILERFDELQDVKTYNSLFKQKKYDGYFIIINQYRILKNYIKKIIRYKNKKKALLERFMKEKIGTRLQYKNFVERINYINSYEKVDNLRVKQIIPEVFLLDKNE